MNLIIEIIDGVAYAFVDAPNGNPTCDLCALDDTSKCCKARLCSQYFDGHYRRLTADERVAVQEALGRGME